MFTRRCCIGPAGCPHRVVRLSGCAALGAPPLSYAELDALLAQAFQQPGELIFLPYLAGSGVVNNDPKLRGAFIGLDAAHSRADLYRAVLEGAAFEMGICPPKGGRIGG